MIYQVWRLSDYTADNLGLAFTGDGLLLGRTPLIERRGARFVVRERSEIAPSRQVLISRRSRGRPAEARARDRRLGTECQ